jgi:hypothetical protein
MGGSMKLRIVGTFLYMAKFRRENQLKNMAQRVKEQTERLL